MGVYTFNSQLDLVTRHACNRLCRFNSVDACGKWNTVLTDDLRTDSVFVREAENILREMVRRHSNGETIASDGLSIENASIDLHTLLRVRFRMHYLDSPSGYGEAPAELVVVKALDADNRIGATMHCGLREPDGNFWYPTKRRVAIILPDDYSNWAYCRSSTYGHETVASWIEMQSDNSGEP